jgi:hypothetical protein
MLRGRQPFKSVCPESLGKLTAQYMAAANGHEAMVHLLEYKDIERSSKNLVATAKLYNAVKRGDENEDRLLL